MTTSPELTALLDLQRRLISDRNRILRELVACSPTEPLPDGALRQLSGISGAAAELAAAIETHTAKLGHGGES